MNNSLAVPGQQQLTQASNSQLSVNTPKWSASQIDTIKRTLCRCASDEEFQLFMAISERTALDPLARQIYAVFRDTWDPQLRQKVRTMTIQTGIDGLRLTAQRSGDYQGQALAEWCGSDGVWRDVWLEKSPPLAARVGVFRRGFAQPLYAVATWASYAQTFFDKDSKQNKVAGQWAKMPDVMLSKCAESAALRKAFPVETCGLYTTEEMGQAEDEIIVIDAEPEKKAAPKQRVYAQISTGQDKKKEPGPVQAELVPDEPAAAPAPAKESIQALRRRAYEDANFYWGNQSEAKVLEFLGGPLGKASIEQCTALIARIEEEVAAAESDHFDGGNGDAPEAY